MRLEENERFSYISRIHFREIGYRKSACSPWLLTLPASPCNRCAIGGSSRHGAGPFVTRQDQRVWTKERCITAVPIRCAAHEFVTGDVCRPRKRRAGNHRLKHPWPCFSAGESAPLRAVVTFLLSTNRTDQHE